MCDWRQALEDTQCAFVNVSTLSFLAHVTPFPENIRFRSLSNLFQVCYNLVNFLQRDEADKQARVDYLKSLAQEEADAEKVTVPA